MKKNIVTFFMVIITLSSCHKDQLLVNDLQVEDEINIENSFVITPEEAVRNLEVFLNGDEKFSTKSVNVRSIANITPIKYNKVNTKSGNTNLNCDNVLYIANFQNDEGYAILAGDTRIGEPVVAIIDDGYLSDATVYTALELASQDRTYYDGYPLDGPGFYTEPETGDEIFINPNTVILYDETTMDTLVGNFSVDTENSEMIAAYLCVSYALNEISGYSSRGSTIGGGDDDNLPDDGPDQQPPFENNPNGPQPLRPWVKTEVSPWITVQCREPLLAAYVSWRQGKPFNDLYPERTKSETKEKVKAPAGCFPLAIAKILAHHELGEEYNGYIVDWKELKKSYESTLGKESAKNLLRDISKGCCCWYFAAGTFTFPGMAALYMRNHGLRNAHKNSYSFTGVTSMIDNDKPLIIYSVPGKDLTISHSWNIDGYKIKQRSITKTTYLGTEVIDVSIETEDTQMVHCDFGWEGRSNGYYVSNVFKLDDPDAEIDDIRSNNTTHYNNYLHIITY